MTRDQLMIRGALFLIACGLALLVAAGVAHGGGFAVAEQSAVAGGTASASTARADDAGAAWYNPAALADDGGLRVGLGVLAAAPSVRAEAMDGAWSAETLSGVSTPPHLQVSFATGDLVFGAAAGVPYGGGVTWPEDWAGRHEIISSRLEVFRVAPFVGYRIGALRVAAGVHADFGRMRINRTLDFVDTEGDVHLDMDGRAFGIDLAAYVQASPEVAVGVSYKSRATLELRGGADFEAPDAFNMKTQDQYVGTVVELPDRIAVGARWHRDRWSVLGDLVITTWARYEQLAIDFDREATPDTTLVTAWGTTVGLRGGAEYAVRPSTVVRGGGFFDPSPARDQHLAPSSPDSTRVGVTAGASHEIARDVTVDGFYEYMHLLGRENGGMDNLAARYGGRAHILGLGVRVSR